MMRRLQMSKRRSLEEQYELVLECRKSGLSDREWSAINESELELLSPWNETVKANCSIEVK